MSSISGSDVSLTFLHTTEHRPYPMPQQPWIVRQDWIDLCFCHWEMEPQVLQKLLPNSLEIDTFEGKAYIGIVPFRMDKVRFRFVPSVPYISSFPELNIRTYVRFGEKHGVFFFSLDAHSQIAVWFGRRFFHVPYHYAHMQNISVENGWTYISKRISSSNSNDAPALFEATQIPDGDTYYATEGSLLHFLTERYCFFSHRPDGKLICSDVHHAPWPIKNSNIEIVHNSLLQKFGIQNPQKPDLVHASSGVPIVGWWPHLIM